MKLFLVTMIAVAAAPAHARTPAAPDAPTDRTFAAMDANGDGVVDRAEYGRFQQAKFDRQATAMDIAFGEMDKNKDGLVSRTEAQLVPIIATSFDGLDANGDGNLSLAEMREALVKAQAIEADADGQ